jgi:hypothetical protein
MHLKPLDRGRMAAGLQWRLAYRLRYPKGC